MSAAPVRAAATRFRRDVTTAAVHAGLRAATGTAVPLALAYTTGNRGFVLAAVGGWLAAMADVGGATRTRVRTMGAYIVLGGLAYAAGADAAGIAAALRAADVRWLGVLLVATLVFCWSAGSALLRTFGDAGATLGVLVAVTFVAALGNPASHLEAALAGGGMIAGGGLWTMLLALGVWRVRPYGAARQATANVYHALAHFAIGIADAAGGAEESGAETTASEVADRFTALAQREHPRVRAALETGRSVLLATRRGRLGAAPRGDDLALLLDGADAVLVTLLALAEAVEVAVTPRMGDDPGTGSHATPSTTPSSTHGALRAAITRSAEALDALGVAIVPGPRAGRRPAALDTLPRAEFTTGRNEIASAQTPDAARHASARLAGALLAQLAGELDRAAELAATLASGGDDTLLATARALLRGRRGASGSRTGRPRWRALGGIDSPTLRHALRIGAAAALAYVLGAVLPIARGPWIPITTLIVLQPSAGLTLRRSTARVLGTVAGGVVAAALAAALRDPRLIAAVVFPLAAAAVALRAVHYGVFTFFLTPVFVLIAQPAPGNWELAGVRAADTALGGLIAVLASVVLWPTWEAASLPGTLAAAVEATRAYAGLAVRRVVAAHATTPEHPVAPAVLATARRRAGLAATAGEDALGRFMAEPGGRGVRAEAAQALLARVRRVTSATTALVGYDAAPSAAAADRLRTLGNAVDATLVDAAAAVRAGHAPDGVPDDLAARVGDAPIDGAALGDDAPAWEALGRVARHALGVRAAAARLADDRAAAHRSSSFLRNNM